LPTKSEATALVTGSSGPLGSTLVSALKSQGYFVVGFDFVSPHVDSAPDQFELVDLLDSEAVRERIRALSAERVISHVVNNAAITSEKAGPGFASDFSAQTDSAFLAAAQVNLLAPFTIVNELIRCQKRPLVSVVNIGSTYGLVGPNLRIYEGTTMGNSAAYAATKGGLIQLTRYLATALAPHTRVNSVSPGGIERNHPQRFVDQYSQLVPLGRMNTESETVQAILFLLGEQASYITGQNLAVDGGWTAW